MTAAEALAQHLQLTVWCADACREGRVVSLERLPPELVFEDSWTRFTCAKCGSKASGITLSGSMGTRPVLRLGS